MNRGIRTAILFFVCSSLTAQIEYDPAPPGGLRRGGQAAPARPPAPPSKTALPSNTTRPYIAPAARRALESLEPFSPAGIEATFDSAGRVRSAYGFSWKPAGLIPPPRTASSAGGGPGDLERSEAEAVEAARAFLAEHAGLAGVSVEDLEVAAVHQAGDLRAVRFQLRHVGLPVLGSSIVALVDEAGAVEGVLSSGAPAEPAHLAPRLSEADAVASARLKLGPGPASRSAVLSVLRVAGRDRLVWDVRLRARGRPWRVLVDATTGDVAGVGDLLRRADCAGVPRPRGLAYSPSPAAGGRALRDLPALDCRSTRLAGSFIRSHDWVGEDFWTGEPLLELPTLGRMPAGQNGGVLYDRTDEASVAQANVYLHATLFHDFVKKLGFNGLDRPLPAVSNALSCGFYFPCENAFYDPLYPYATGFGLIIFGMGPQVNLGFDGDVIYHEYTHGVVEETAQLGDDFFDPDILFSMALNEAFADYFSSTFAGDPLVGEYSGRAIEDSRALRDLSGPSRWPDDVDVIDPHQTGLIWGGALWGIRQSISGGGADAAGVARADRLAYACLVSLPSTADLLQAAEALVAVAPGAGLSAAEAATVKDVLFQRGLRSTGGAQSFSFEDLASGEKAVGDVAAVVGGVVRVASLQYRVTVPEDGAKLVLDLRGTGGARELDLYVRFSAPVGDFGGTITSTYRAETPGASETLTIDTKSSPSLSPGVYFVAIANRSAAVAGFELQATVELGAGARLEPLAAGASITSSLAGNALSPVQYTVEVPVQTLRRLELAAVADGDIELLLRHGSPVEIGDEGKPLADVIVRSPARAPRAVLGESTLPPLKRGTYHVALRNLSSGVVTFTLQASEPAAPPAAVQEMPLAFGAARSGTAAAAPPGTGLLQTEQFAFTVPADGAVLSVALRTAGDLALYLRRGSPVDLTTGQIRFDHASSLDGPGDEAVLVDLLSSPPLAPAKYFAAIVSYGDQTAGYEIQADLTTAAPNGSVRDIASAIWTSGVAEGSGGAPGGKLSAVQYRIAVGGQAGGLDVILNPQAPGDLDLYVRFGRPVQMVGGNVVADLSAVTERGAEAVTIALRDLRQGDYYIGVLNHAAAGVAYEVIAVAEPDPISYPLEDGDIVEGDMSPAPNPPTGCRLSLNQFVVDVPANAFRLEVLVLALDGGPLGIMTRRGSRILIDQGLAVLDEETSTRDGPVVVEGADLLPGLYFFALTNCQGSPQRYQVQVTLEVLSGSEVPLRDGIPLSGLAAPGRPGEPVLHPTQYSIDVPPGAGELAVAAWGLDCSSGDLDVLVALGERVTLEADGRSNADWRADALGAGSAAVSINTASSPRLTPGTYFIAVASREPRSVEFQVGAGFLPEASALVPAGQSRPGTAPPSPAPGSGVLEDLQRRVVVPAGSGSITFDLSGAGDVDLLVRYALPIGFDAAGDVLANYIADTDTGQERVVIPPPGSGDCLRPGTYFLVVGNFESRPVNYTLKSELQGQDPITAALGDTVDGTQLAAAGGEIRPPERQIVVTVPAGAKGFQVDLIGEVDGAAGNLDLFVRAGLPVEFGARVVATYGSENAAGLEWITVPASKLTPGPYYIAVGSRAARTVPYRVRLRALGESSRDLIFFRPESRTAEASSAAGIPWLSTEQFRLPVPSGLPNVWVKLTANDGSSRLELHLRRGLRVEGDGSGIIADRSGAGAGASHTLVMSSPAAGDLYLAIRNLLPREERFRIEAGTGALALRGDVDENGLIDLTDPITVLQHLFLAGPAVCGFAADADATETLDLTDPIYILTYLFLAGPPPAQPFPDCGPAVSTVGGECGGTGCR